MNSPFFMRMKSFEKQMIRTRLPFGGRGPDHLDGPSDWARTSGLMVPNHALYQLSYTRK